MSEIPLGRPCRCRVYDGLGAPVSSPRTQPVLAPLTPAAIFLVATINEGGHAQVHDALADLAGLVRGRFPRPGQAPDHGDLDRLRRLGPIVQRPRPAELHPFPELQGPRHHAPATPGDLLFHLCAESPDFCLFMESGSDKQTAPAASR